MSKRHEEFEWRRRIFIDAARKAIENGRHLARVGACLTATLLIVALGSDVYGGFGVVWFAVACVVAGMQAHLVRDILDLQKKLAEWS